MVLYVRGGPPSSRRDTSSSSLGDRNVLTRVCDPGGRRRLGSCGHLRASRKVEN